MPTIRAGLEQLRAGEDVTLVEVKEPGQHVLVAERGGSVVVNVTGDDETVRVLSSAARHRKHHRTSCRRESRHE